MGGTQTHAQIKKHIYNKHGGIYIQLYQYEHFTVEKETVDGMVHVSINQHFSPCTLEFKFSGKEETYWTEQKQSGKHLRTIQYHGKKIITKLVSQVMKIDDYLQPGALLFLFPFLWLKTCQDLFL